MRYLVTGGCGFIGSHLAEALLEKGEVVIVDNLSTGFEKNVPEGAEFVKLDISDSEKVNSISGDFDIIFHLAAQSSVIRSLEQPLVDFNSNALGTLNILEYARKKGTKTVYASSCAGYGDAVYLPVDEMHPLKPKSPYAASKIAGEKMCEAYTTTFELPTMSLRFFNVYGPRQSGNSGGVISIFISRAMKSEPLKMNGDGEQFRDFVYVKDVVSSLLKAGESPCKGEAVNIGTGKKTTVNEITESILKITKSSSEVQHGPELPGESKGIVADISMAKEVLGFEPTVDLETGIKETFEYIKKG